MQHYPIDTKVALDAIQGPAQLDWLDRIAKGLADRPLAFFCALLVVTIIYLARQHQRNADQLAALNKDYGATMVRLEHVLGGLTRMRDEYKRQLAALKKGAPDE